LISRDDIEIEINLDAEIIKDNINEGNRELFRLRFEEDMSWREIAEVLKTTPEAVRQRYSRELVRIRKKFGIPPCKFNAKKPRNKK